MNPLHSIKLINKTALFLLMIVLSSSLAFYGIIINWPQDNPYDEVRIEIPKGATLSEIIRILDERRILSNKKAFLVAVKLLGYETDIPAGIFILKRAKTNYRIIDQLVNGSPILRKVTILEGWTVKRIAKLLAERVDVNEDRFLQLCNDPQLARQLGVPAPSMEGFLFPETYYFYEGETPESIIATMVATYRKTVQDEVRARAAEIGFTELELITLASIIEGEAIYDSERATISAVYHNRLKLGMKLQADPTIQYIISDSPRRLLNKDLKIDSPYNTYLYYGLPPGPINNPGKGSILAALYPENNDYLYFVARGDGYHTFSRTQRDHNRAKKKFQRVRQKLRRELKRKEQG